MAAFIKANGAELLAYQDSKFCFRSNKSFKDWQMEHMNSCCKKVDLELIALRELKRNPREVGKGLPINPSGLEA